jgi:hypothetical protein
MPGLGEYGAKAQKACELTHLVCCEPGFLKDTPQASYYFSVRTRLTGLSIAVALPCGLSGCAHERSNSSPAVLGPARHDDGGAHCSLGCGMAERRAP